MKNSYLKGEIVSIDLGLPPEIKGHEQSKERPCVIIRALNNSQLVIIVPCTSKKQNYNELTTVKLLKTKGNLKTDSFVLCGQIRSVSFERIKSKIGYLDIIELLKIQSVLIDTLEI